MEPNVPNGTPSTLGLWFAALLIIALGIGLFMINREQPQKQPCCVHSAAETAAAAR